MRYQSKQIPTNSLLCLLTGANRFLSACKIFRRAERNLFSLWNGSISHLSGAPGICSVEWTPDLSPFFYVDIWSSIWWPKNAETIKPFGVFEACLDAWCIRQSWRVWRVGRDSRVIKWGQVVILTYAISLKAARSEAHGRPVDKRCLFFTFPYDGGAWSPTVMLLRPLFATLSSDFSCFDHLFPLPSILVQRQKRMPSEVPSSKSCLNVLAGGTP